MRADIVWLAHRRQEQWQGRDDGRYGNRHRNRNSSCRGCERGRSSAPQIQELRFEDAVDTTAAHCCLLIHTSTWFASGLRLRAVVVPHMTHLHTVLLHALLASSTTSTCRCTSCSCCGGRCGSDARSCRCLSGGGRRLKQLTAGCASTTHGLINRGITQPPASINPCAYDCGLSDLATSTSWGRPTMALTPSCVQPRPCGGSFCRCTQALHAVIQANPGRYWSWVQPAASAALGAQTWVPD